MMCITCHKPAPVFRFSLSSSDESLPGADGCKTSLSLQDDGSLACLL